VEIPTTAARTSSSSLRDRIPTLAGCSARLSSLKT